MAAPQMATSRTVPTAEDPSGPPRKKRKRTSAAGASADCFACQNLNIKCDRRRPYCSQCLDQGKDCSGYKTQLTWGVGVASRGKLRGLSLPIAGSTQKATSSEQSPKQGRQTSSSIRGSTTKSSSPTTTQSETISPVYTTSQSTFSTATAGSSSISLTGIPTPPWSAGQSTTVNSTPAAAYAFESEPPDVPPPLYHFGDVQKAPHDPYVETSPASTSSTGPIHRNLSPGSYSRSHQTTPYFGQPDVAPTSMPTSVRSPRSYRIPDLLSPEPAYSLAIPSMPSYAPESCHYMNTSFENSTNSQSVYYPPIETVPFQEDDDAEDIGRGNCTDELAIIDSSPTFSSIPLDIRLGQSPFGNMTNIGKTPRMQYLINYYAEVISPVIVAFDGPTNPYRTQILRLAANSETLQHAISALSASNLRQRRESGTLSTGKTDPARRSSMAYLTVTDESFHQAVQLSPLEQAREETHHRRLAIQSLNAQLANPILRMDDAILATLLILCLFHMCDSGIAKFQTQFAGVRKLLNLRGTELGINSDEAKWFTRMFSWYDVLSATVNDRENQLRGHHLDVTALSDEEWALENLAGCDGQLFKAIAKLGRLNVLSQGKKVDETPALVSKPFPNLPFLDGDVSVLDGNGWACMMSDEELFNIKTAEPDLREQFWREWREVRHELQTWYLDTTVFDSLSSGAHLLSTEQRMDLREISESFRYSALLYTERLAHPTAASSDENIQSWVRQSLAHIKLVKSDVYLLWPLFITGSECVTQADISIIRERCLDIQKDSGFLNNKSCLELLEKVWKENPAVIGNSKRIKRESLSPEAGKPIGSGFTFSEIMRREGNDGEYIVV